MFFIDISTKQKEFIKKEFIIHKLDTIEKRFLDVFSKKISDYAARELNLKKAEKFFFDNTHKYINEKDINNFRMKMFKFINDDFYFRKNYYNLFKQYLSDIIGSEIGIQRSISLSIHYRF